MKKPSLESIVSDPSKTDSKVLSEEQPAESLRNRLCRCFTAAEHALSIRMSDRAKGTRALPNDPNKLAEDTDELPSIRPPSSLSDLECNADWQ